MMGTILKLFEEIVATSWLWNDQDITHLQSERLRMFSSYVMQFTEALLLFIRLLIIFAVVDISIAK